MGLSFQFSPNSDKILTGAVTPMAYQKWGEMIMNWIAVSSTRMTAVAHEGSTMYIRFTDGATYAYDNVSVAEFNNFLNSPSLGRELITFQQHHPYRPV